MNALSGYLLCMICAAILGALVKSIVPQNGAGRVVKLAVGMVIILSVVSPILKLDAQQLSSFFAQSQIISEHARTGIEIPTQDLAAEIISEKVKAYVLDKAGELGIQIEVEVSMQTGGTYPYPDEITVSGTMNEIQRQELQHYIASTFAIPADRQVYNE